MSIYWVPESQGTSVGALWDRTAIPSNGEQASARGSLTPTVGDKGCTASSGYLLSCHTTCCTGWLLSVSGRECCLKETLDGPSWWVLLLLTRNDRGMAGWWLRELMGDKVLKKILQYKPAGVWKVSSFMLLFEPHMLRCRTPVGTCSVTMPRLEVSSTNTACHLHKSCRPFTKDKPAVVLSSKLTLWYTFYTSIWTAFALFKHLEQEQNNLTFVNIIFTSPKWNYSIKCI